MIIRDVLFDQFVWAIDSEVFCLGRQFHRGRMPRPRPNFFSDLESRYVEEPVLLDYLKNIERLLAKYPRNQLENLRGPTELNFKFNVFVEEIPIYKDLLIFAQQKEIFEPTEFPNLSLMFNFQKSMVADENHGPGYHFHYLNKKGNRTTCCITFDPKSNANEPPSYYFYHGSYTKIKIEEMGKNKKYPIHSICHEKMRSKGIQNFMAPGKDAQIFYDPLNFL